jgi:hypothetical protein
MRLAVAPTRRCCPALQDQWPIRLESLCCLFCPRYCRASHRSPSSRGAPTCPSVTPFSRSSTPAAGHGHLRKARRPIATSTGSSSGTSRRLEGVTRRMRSSCRRKAGGTRRIATASFVAPGVGVREDSASLSPEPRPTDLMPTTPDNGLSMPQDGTYTRSDVLSAGFEACCVDDERFRYVCHNGIAIRIDDQRRTRALVTNPRHLPQGPWMATPLGERELADPQVLRRLESCRSSARPRWRRW